MSIQTHSRGAAGRPRWKLLAVSAGVGFAGLIAYYAHWSLVLHRFSAVTEHQLYQSAQMPPDELLQVARKHRIRTVVDLRTPEQAAEIDAERIALDGTEVNYIHLPANDVPDNATVLAFLEIVGNPANRPVLVHCHHGTGRSVLFSSLFRVAFENWDPEVARRAVEPLHWRGNFAPHAPKGAYLLSFEPPEATVVFATD